MSAGEDLGRIGCLYRSEYLGLLAHCGWRPGLLPYKKLQDEDEIGTLKKRHINGKKASELVRTLPNTSEHIRMLRNASEHIRTRLHTSENI